MCGIAGYYGLSDAKLLDVMNDAQAHRGPDGSGTYADGAVGLAHLRLAIIDRAGGMQPMSLADETLTIAFNGEIYNYLALRAELESAGRKFVTKSDTEVLLHGYREWGDELWDRLNGMFAVALYDKSDASLRLVRDHFGIKPLYYTQPADGQILFASEIKALLATGKVARAANDSSVYRYLMFRLQDDGKETFFRDVSRLESGHIITIKDGTITDKAYTTLEQDLLAIPGTKSYQKGGTEKFAAAFEESIKLRLQSEVPVGTSLSGGLDSSAVAAVIAERLANTSTAEQLRESVGTRQKTFSAVFPHSINDEEAYVDAFLGQYGDAIEPHKIKPTAEEFADDLTDFIRTQEEPIVSSGPYAQYQVMREASKHVTVLLDGQGADEMMAGYIPYYFVYFRELRRQRKWGKLLLEVVMSLDILFRLGRFTIASRLSFKKRTSVRQLLDTEFSTSHNSEKMSVERSDLRARLVQDLFHHSIPSLLRYEDRNTMRFGIEGRVPFLDKELLTELFSYDNSAIILHGINKRALRDSMHGKLPEKIRARRNKIGFTTPEYEWVMKLKKEFFTVFNSQSFAARPYLNNAAVLSAFEDFIHGRSDATSMVFWRLMNLELWMREFIDEPEKLKADEAIEIKEPLAPNAGKKLDIVANGTTYRRFPIQTERVSAETDISEFVTHNVNDFLKELSNYDDKKSLEGKKWYLYISEKVVAITQGRAYFIWDIHAGFWARTLSRFVRRTPAGIGLGSPWTMEIAIREAGLPRILFATIGSIGGKLLGKRGVFYNLVGENVRAIDGPTQYSVFPANVSAKLPPKDPHIVAGQLKDALQEAVPDKLKETFGGVVIIDANDIGRNVLGTTLDLPEVEQEEIFGDNPLGQARQQTPLAFVVRLGDK